MDMQAQDRAHRIGQTRPVLIFRIVTAHTIENTIMERANQKRRLEALVIAKGLLSLPFNFASTLLTLFRYRQVQSPWISRYEGRREEQGNTR